MINSKGLDGKKVLYIGLDYFDYPVQISNSIEKLGAEVVFFPIFQSGNKIKIIRRISQKYTNLETERYFKTLFDFQINFDYVFFITVHWVPLEIVKRIKEKFTKAKFILYNWDSLITHDYLPYKNIFDRIFSFDRNDCETHGFDYLPLFYNNNFIKNDAESGKKRYDIVFVGRYNNIRRYLFLKEVYELAKVNNLRFYHYLFIHWTTYVKLCLKLGKLLNLRFFKFRKMEFSQISELYNSSECVIDLPNNFQSGLTMRVIETLGNHSKLMTTNENIKREPFYNEEIIKVLDPEKLDIDVDFLKKHVCDSEFQLIKEYALDIWVKKIFEVE